MSKHYEADPAAAARQHESYDALRDSELRHHADVLFNYQGSVVLVTPVSQHAKEWFTEYVSPDFPTLGNALGMTTNEAENCWSLAMQAGLRCL